MRESPVFIKNEGGKIIVEYKGQKTAFDSYNNVIRYLEDIEDLELANEKAKAT